MESDLKDKLILNLEDNKNDLSKSVNKEIEINLKLDKESNKFDILFKYKI
jgi:hypothetical protein